jgi:DNA mismatch endonuclease (patch repair protein)
VLPRWKLAVFVDGCFWHGCPQHGPKNFRGPNAERWEEKLTANRLRDIRNDAALREAGWGSVRIFECEIRDDPTAAAERVKLRATGPVT